MAKPAAGPFAIAVHAVKGGAGKTSISVSLARELSTRGLKVGLIDADLDSPFAAEVLDAKEKITLDAERRMVPLRLGDLRFMSFACYVQNGSYGASMRGDFHSTWITDAIQSTDWGDTEILVFDCPAGSSDEWLTMRRLFADRLLGIVAVGLPNLASSLERVWHGASNHRIRILGCIENMSGPVFGAGGVKTFCDKKGLKFFGSVPLDARIREAHEQHRSQLPDDLLAPVRAAADQVQSMLPKRAVAR